MTSVNVRSNVQADNQRLPLFTQIILSVSSDTTLENFFKGRMEAYLALHPHEDTEESQSKLSKWMAEALGAAQADYALAQQVPLPYAEAEKVEEVYAQIPQQQRVRLKHLSAGLSNRLSQRYPPASGETLTKTLVTGLLSSWQDYHPGTVVCVQESNFGTVAYLFPHLLFDREKLQLTVPPGHIFITQQGVPQLYSRPNLMLVATATSGNAIGKAFLTFATTAAFVIPAPWGVLLSGGLSVLQMFLGSEGHDNNTLADTIKKALQDAVTMMRTTITSEKIKEAMATLEAETMWVNNSFTAIKALSDERNAASSFVQDTLQKINTSLGPENKLGIYFYEMKQIVDDSNTDLDLRDQAFDAMVTLASLHLTFMKLRVQLKSWQILDTSDDTFYAWYDEFLEKTSGEAGYITLISQVYSTLRQDHQNVINNRINQVGDLQHAEVVRQPVFNYATGTWYYPSPVEREGAAKESYWYFVDAGQAGDHRWYDTVTNERFDDCHILTSFEDVQHRVEAAQARQTYIDDLRKKLTDPVTQKFANVDEGLNKWKSNVEDWKVNKPPRIPSKAPTISFSDSKDWCMATPLGQNWVNGAKLRYGIAFKNSKGGTPPVWSDYFTVKDMSYPILTGIPTDPLGIAQSRVIYRQFAGQAEKKVKIITDSSTTEYQDKRDMLISELTERTQPPNDGYQSLDDDQLFQQWDMLTYYHKCGWGDEELKKHTIDGLRNQFIAVIGKTPSIGNPPGLQGLNNRNLINQYGNIISNTLTQIFTDITLRKKLISDLSASTIPPTGGYEPHTDDMLADQMAMLTYYRKIPWSDEVLKKQTIDGLRNHFIWVISYNKLDNPNALAGLQGLNNRELIKRYGDILHGKI